MAKKRWAVHVAFLVEAEDGDDAVVTAARACQDLRTKGVLPSSVQVGEPMGGGDLEYVWEVFP